MVLLTQLFAIWLLILMYGLVFYTHPWSVAPPPRRLHNLTQKRVTFNQTASAR